MRYINFKDSSCYSVDTPFYLVNVESGKYWADGVIYIQYNTNISGQDVGIPIYFEKVLTGGVWDETTVIIRNYNVNGVWDKPKIHGSDTTALNSDDKNRTNPTFKIVDNGNDTFKIRINARTDYVGFQTSGGNIVNPVRINRTNNGSDFINWAIVRADSDYVIGRTYSDDFIEFTDDRCFSQSNPVYLCNVDARKWWADGVSYNNSNSSISAQSTGIPIYLEKVLSGGTWDGSTVKLHMYNNNSTWDEVYYDSSNNTLLSNNQNQQSNTFSLTANEDGSFKMKLNSLSTLVGFREYISSYEGVYRYLVQPISTDISSSEAAAHTNWAISTIQNPSLHRYIANDTSNPQLIAIAQSQGWIESETTDLFSDDVILPASDANSTSIFSTLTSFAELAYCEEITQIPDYCFYNCTSLSGLTFHNGITSIGESAFMGCTSLTRFYAGDPINIGANAFKNSGISQFALGPSISTIGSDAFAGLTLGWVRFYDLTSMFSVNYSNANSNPISRTLKTGVLGRVVIGDGSDVIVESIIVPSTITEIKPYALYYGQAFTTITLHNNVTSIGAYAFYNCKALTTFDTKNVTTIGADAFNGCSALNKVVCNSIANWFNISFGNEQANPLTRAHHLYVGSTEQISITIPENAVIKPFVLNGASYITKLIIPTSVTMAGITNGYSLKGTTSLLSAGPIGGGYDIEFGWTTSIPRDIFFYSSINTIKIPETATSIGQNAFSNAANLKIVDIPESCVSIGNMAFSNSLECLVIRSNNITLSLRAFGYGQGSTRRIYFTKSTPPKSFQFQTFTSGEAFVWVPKGSKSAYETFFSGKGYTVKEGDDFSLPLEIIDPVNTELLNIAKSYDWVPNEATYLTTLDCSQVNDSRLAAPGPSGYEDLETFPELKYFLGITTIPTNLFSDSSFSGDIIVPDNVIEIGTGAFHGCGTNSKVIINNAYINSDAFTESNPKEIYLGDGVETSSDSNPFTYCPDTKYYVSEDNLTIAHTRDHTGITDVTGGALITLNKSLLIPHEIHVIGPRALVQNSGNSGQLILPKNIEYIDDSALEQQTYNKVFARSLKTLEVGELNTTIGTLYVPEGKIEEYTDAWTNVYSIGEIKEFKTQKSLPLTRRDTKSKQIEWTSKYTRVTSVMRWGNNQEGDIDIELPINKIGGFSVYSMNSRSWGTYNNNHLIGARKNNVVYLTIHYSGNTTHIHPVTWNNTAMASNHIVDGQAPTRRTLTVIDSTGKVHYDYNYNNNTITKNISSGLQTSDAGIRFLCQEYMGNNYHYLGYKIYDAEFYGRNDDGTCSNVLISKLIPVLRKSDNKPGLYDLIRHKFFTKSESGNLGWERAIVPNDGIQYNATNAPLCDTHNGTDAERRWRYGGHGIGKTVYESNWSSNDGSDGKQCAFWYLAAPGKVTFHNTFTNRCDLLLENDYGRRVYAKGCAANATTEWNINEKLWKDANYLSIVFWDKPVLANLIASDWYFTYSDLEVKYEDLPQGYTRIEYIEKTEGTAWIDTGRAGTSGNLFELVFGLIVENGAFKNFIVGSLGPTPDNNRNLFTMGTYNGPQKRNSYNNSVPQSILPITEDKHTLIMDTRNSTFTCSIDGNNINVRVPSGTINGNGGNISIFRNNNGGGTGYYGRIYRFKVGVTADIKPSRDFIPCINDQNEVGLFDLVYRKFYGSQTSDTFTAGPIVSSSENN